MPLQTLTIYPMSGGRIIRQCIQAPDAASLIKAVAERVTAQARRFGVSPLAIEYELEEVR